MHCGPRPGSDCNEFGRSGAGAHESHSTSDETHSVKGEQQATDSSLQGSKPRINCPCRKIRSGTPALPNELLLHIFELLLEACDDPFDTAKMIIRDISLVSQQFREIVLTFAPVWTYIDLNICRDHSVELMLLRSRNEQLSVRFKYSDDLKQAVFRVLDHIDQWHYLDAEFTSAYRELVDYRAPIAFPSIEELHICLHTACVEDEAIFARWIFPYAEHVVLVDAIPTANSFLRETLKTFKYSSRNGGRLNSDLSFLRRLTTSLTRAVSLHTLTLDLEYIYYPGWIKDTERVELPCVTNFCISNCRQGGRYTYSQNDPPMSLSMFARVIRALKMPNLQDISISIAFFEDMLNLSDWLSLAFPSSHELLSLTSLEFNVLWMPLDRSLKYIEMPICTFLERFLSLKALSLDAKHVKVSFCDGIPQDVADVRMLNIRNCENNSGELCNVFRDMAEYGITLEEIKIYSMHDIDEAEVKSIVPDAQTDLFMSGRDRFIQDRINYDFSQER